MPKHSFNTLMRRLSRAGFRRQFVTAALLPDWWEDSYAQDSTVLPEIEIRVARFLNVPLGAVKNTDAPLLPPPYGHAQLRSIRDIDRDRLHPAIHAAVRVAEAVVRNLRYSSPAGSLFTDALEWRSFLTSGERRPVQLEDILHDLWQKRVPVIPMEVLPTPGFQGLACIVDGYPVIVLGHKYDEPGRIAFLIAHEVGHIVAGDCSPGTLVLDENEAVQDESEGERAADDFAQRLLLGEATLEDLEISGRDPKALARVAFELEIEKGVDASSVIYAWASRTLNYAVASLAVKALYRSVGARRQVRMMFDEHVDPDSASESDRALLRCVYGDRQPTTIAD